MAEIRNLLNAAQQAELHGKKDEAIHLLREAAAWYRDRQMLKRAAQMLRQARRVEGVDDEDEGAAVFGFGSAFEGDALQAPSTPPAPQGVPDEALRTDGKVLIEQRSPQLAAPALDAWCSFCCRPKAEVGPLVAGPAGAFVCRDCVGLSADLLQRPLPVPRATAPDPAWTVTALPFELRAQRRARLRFTRARSRLALVIGPEGTGKSAWLRSLGEQPDLRRVEVRDRLGADAEAELLRWLDAPARAAFLELRAPVPPPALVLQGEDGEEPLHDTASLVEAVPQLSLALLGRVDAVLPFDPPLAEELAELAQALAEARGVWLPRPALAQLVGLAQRAQRGAHELATLIARIPPGKYRP